jgi:hypothetical protein
MLARPASCCQMPAVNLLYGSLGGKLVASCRRLQASRVDPVFSLSYGSLGNVHGG